MKSILCAILASLLIVNQVSGACQPVSNQDSMIEYACEYGHPNDLYQIPQDAEKISISHMKIPRITADTFSRFGRNLVVLACTHCNIEDIEPDSFRALVNLQQLRLDNNHLKTVRASWFEGLGQLSYLDLNYNDIEHIENGVFDRLPELNDVRISGNKLECLNVDELGRLGRLERIFLTENPNFKCPHAVARVLAEKQLDFDQDHEWRQLQHDLVPPQGSGYIPTTTPPYRERITYTTPPPTTYDRETTAPNYPTSASYSSYETTSDASRWSTIPWYSTASYTSEPSYPTHEWSTESRETEPTPPPYNGPYYPPQVPRSTTQDPWTADTKYPEPTSTAKISYTGPSDETFIETNPPFETMPPATRPPPPPPTPPIREEPVYQTSRNEPKQASPTNPPPIPLENYQQIDEKGPVTVSPTSKSHTDKPAKGGSASQHLAASTGFVLLTFFYSLTRTF